LVDACPRTHVYSYPGSNDAKLQRGTYERLLKGSTSMQGRMLLQINVKNKRRCAAMRWIGHSGSWDPKATRTCDAVPGLLMACVSQLCSHTSRINPRINPLSTVIEHHHNCMCGVPAWSPAARRCTLYGSSWRPLWCGLIASRMRWSPSSRSSGSLHTAELWQPHE
jgi:hypothetical protein